MAKGGRFYWIWKLDQTKKNDYGSFLSSLCQISEVQALVGSLFLTFTIPSMGVKLESESGDGRDILTVVLLLIANASLALSVLTCVLILSNVTRYNRETMDQFLKSFTGNVLAIPTVCLFIGIPTSFAAYIVQNERNWEIKSTIAGIALGLIGIVLIIFYSKLVDLWHKQLDKADTTEVEIASSDSTNN